MGLAQLLRFVSEASAHRYRKRRQHLVRQGHNAGLLVVLKADNVVIQFGLLEASNNQPFLERGVIRDARLRESGLRQNLL